MAHRSPTIPIWFLLSLCLLLVGLARSLPPRILQPQNQTIAPSYGDDVFRQRRLLEKDAGRDPFARQLSDSLHDRKKELPRRDIKYNKVPNKFEFEHSYAESIILLGVPGLSFALLFIIYGAIIGLVTFFPDKFCPCMKRKKSKQKQSNKGGKAFRFTLGVNFILMIFFGIAVLIAIPYLSDGIDEFIWRTKDSIDTAVVKVEILNTEFNALSNDLPRRLDYIVGNMTVLLVLSRQLSTLSTQLNSTNEALIILFDDVDGLRLPDLPAYQDCNQTLREKTLKGRAAIEASYEIQQNLNEASAQLNDDYYALAADIQENKRLLRRNTRKIRYQIRDTRKEAIRIQKEVYENSEHGESFKDTNSRWTTFFFLIPFFGLLLMWIGLKIEKQEIAISGFVLLFISGIVFWILFAIYLPTGVAMSDYCDEPHVVLMKGLDHVDGDPGIAVKGCYNRMTVFKSLGHEDKLQISYYLDYDDYLTAYYEMKGEHNITQVSMAADSLSELIEDDEAFNIPDVQVSDLGFQEEAIDQSLNRVNAITMTCCELYYDASNITELDPQSLDQLDDEKKVELMGYQRTTIYLIRMNNTLYDYTNELNQNLTRVEMDVEYVRSNISAVVDTTDEILYTLVLLDEAVHNVTVLLNTTQDDIDAVALLSDCSFLADDYEKISDGLCTTTISGVDSVWFSSIVIAGCIFTYLWTSRIMYNRVFIQPPFMSQEMAEFFSKKAKYGTFSEK